MTAEFEVPKLGDLSGISIYFEFLTNYLFQSQLSKHVSNVVKTTFVKSMFIANFYFVQTGYTF